MDKLSTANLSRRARNLLFFSQPKHWPAWPYLPLVKRQPGQAEVHGVLFDAMGYCGLPGYSATVFLGNLFLLPDSCAEFLALPKEVFDQPEEIADAGWCVD